ncbi:MAG: 4Fe-4S binding protein [Chloroflexota bacterium]
MAGGAVRKIVRIDEEKCNGCGLCVPGCVEGALQVVDGKARLISETYCDGLGACLGECPEGAITIEERMAEKFDEEAAKQHVAPQAPACSCAGSAVGHPGTQTEAERLPCGCPGSAVRQFEAQAGVGAPPVPQPLAGSALSQWPVQLTLVPPTAPFLKQADLLLVADCVPFAYAGFHRDMLRGHALLVACPKLDDFQAHRQKLTEILRQSGAKSLTVVHVEVPCCHGLVHMAREAMLASGRAIPLKERIIGVRGELIS